MNSWSTFITGVLLGSTLLKLTVLFKIFVLPFDSGYVLKDFSSPSFLNVKSIKNKLFDNEERFASTNVKYGLSCNLSLSSCVNTAFFGTLSFIHLISSL